VGALGLTGSREKAGSCPNKILALYLQHVLETVTDEEDVQITSYTERISDYVAYVAFQQWFCIFTNYGFLALFWPVGGCVVAA
jgi:hypothetical protein